MTDLIQNSNSWQIQHDIEVDAHAGAIWGLFSDVAGWRTWNPGVEASELEGPFAAGSWFTMTPTGAEPLRSRLLDARENECFVDETRVMIAADVPDVLAALSARASEVRS